jgi:hypothetical protein
MLQTHLLRKRRSLEREVDEAMAFKQVSAFSDLRKNRSDLVLQC